MAKHSLACVAAVIVPLLGGCYPMEQAPLVYSSKSTIGVGVTAGTPENPGLDVTIGFKETNVALVPVAVAKYCRHSNAANCANAAYAMQIIRGGKVDTVANRAIDAAFASNQDEVIKLSSEIRQIELEKKTAENNLQLLTRRSEAQASLATLGTAPVDGELESQTSARADAQAVMTATAGVNAIDPAAERTRVASANALLQTKNERLFALNNDIARLRTQLIPDTKGARDDALSVYGTFRGSGTGDANGASLTGGKIFATGIAAQNLSEHAGVADCLAAVGVLAQQFKGTNADEARNGLLSDAGEVCKHRPAHNP